MASSSERVALVTGASRGIGHGIAGRLGRDGWQVDTAERATGVDLSDLDAARSAVERLERIDALVANAGTAVRRPALEHSIEDWERVLRVNLTSVFVLAQTAARRMVEAGARAFLTKPLDVKELHTLLDAVASEREGVVADAAPAHGG